jgi:hypothetical protein
MGGFRLGALWAGYLRLMETRPFSTKVVTSASLNAVGDIMGQTLFEEGKPFDWLRLAKFAFLVCYPSLVQCEQCRN